MKRKKAHQVFQLTEQQVWLAEKEPTGFLIALWLEQETASKLALSGGEPADSLHITIAYCGDAAELGELLQAKAISAVDEAVHYMSPLAGKISGYGRFEASDSSDGQDVFYASPDIPQLTELRQCIVNCLADNGIAVSTNHGYTPHITLAYLDPDAKNPVDEVELLDLKFSGVTVMAGTRRVDIPFWNPYPVDAYSMSETVVDVPPEALLGSQPARALFFGSIDKEWISFLPKPGVYNHEQFGTMDLTSAAYDQMLANFNNYVFKQDLPIRATHRPSDGGAVGWIRPGGMRKADDGSLEVKPEWNDLGKGLVEGDRFRYVSAEFCKEWTNPVTDEVFPNVAVGLALVTRPHFKTDVLNPLSEREALAFSEETASLVSGLIDGGTVDFPITFMESGDAGKGNQVTEEEKVALAAAQKLVDDAAAAAKLAEATTKVEDPAPQAIVLGSLKEVVVSAADRAKERVAFADLTSRVELAERRATIAEGDMATMKHERLVEKFTAEVTGRSAENDIAWFGDIQNNVDHMVSLAEHHGEKSKEVQWAVVQKRNEAEAIRNTNIFDPISLGATDAIQSVNAQVQMLADQQMKADPTLTPEEAQTKVYNANPELYMKTIKKS